MKLVCISDTHGLHRKLAHSIPDGDVLLHAGDMTNTGGVFSLTEFAKWMGGLPHRRKLAVCGNHELEVSNNSPLVEEIFGEYGIEFAHQRTIDIDGFKIYGESRTPEFFDWGWMYSRGEDARIIWDAVPEGIDLLLCHGPPLGFGDKCPDLYDRSRMVKVGCEQQLEMLLRVRPKYVVCGHIHESYGIHKTAWGHVINASMCTGEYRPTNRPITIDTTTGTIGYD